MWLFAFSRFLIWCLPRRTSWDGRPIGTTAGIGLLASEGKVYAQLSCLVSLCRPGCPGTQRSNCLSPLVLGLKACTTTPNRNSFLETKELTLTMEEIVCTQGYPWWYPPQDKLGRLGVVPQRAMGSSVGDIWPSKYSHPWVLCLWI